MKFWMAPTKKQLIIISAITLFLFLYPMVKTIFFSEDLSNRQYLIFGGLACLGLVNVIVAFALYKAKKQNLVSK